jgi:hypothetical protein
LAGAGVVYLYRFGEGEGPVRRFLDSYRAHSAGLAHDLHVIFKGFPNRNSLDSARALFASLPINTIELDDVGYDIGSYFAATRAVANPQLVFLNTFSEILVDNWLLYYDQALHVPGVGLVGATGSLQSLSSGFEAGLAITWRHVVRHFKKKSDARVGAVTQPQDHVNAGNIARGLLQAPLYPLRVYQYGRYPNPHIRTNAFMIRRDLFLSLHTEKLKKKADAYRFESGRASMTRQIMARGLSPVVIDRTGRCYTIPYWRSSSTFWVEDQANLVIADNQTRDYIHGDPEFREGLRHKAWDHPLLWKSRVVPYRGADR